MTRDYFIPSTTFTPLEENGIPIGFVLGNVSRLCSDLFITSYREIICTKCLKMKMSSEFQWKLKGFEGPFKKYWGRRQSMCKECERKIKSEAYLRRVKFKKRRNPLLKEYVITEKEINLIPSCSLKQLLSDLIEEVLHEKRN